MVFSHNGPFQVLLGPQSLPYSVPTRLGLQPPTLQNSFTPIIEPSRICASVPAGIAVACIIFHLFRRALPEGPQWTRRFALEEAPRRGRTWSHWSPWTYVLLSLSAIGLIFSILDLATHSSFSIIRVCEPLPWLAALLHTLATRPGRTPKTLLIIFASTFICNSISTILAYNDLKHVNPLAVAQLITALVAVLVILHMPMRHPNISNDGIAKPFEVSNSGLRSPEDDLTLWQFMTVTWMSPLLMHSYRKTLDEQDVWLLPYEFQHERLHLLFRELRGSILKRLLVANTLDLITTVCLGVLEAIANLSTPILLQKLLQSISEDGSHMHESLIFATAILVIRLIAAQSGVFSLWYCRRAYERSRGEMLTMVYAKTLARKSKGGHIEEKSVESTNENSDTGLPHERNCEDNGNGHSHQKNEGQTLRQKLVSWLPFKKKAKAEEAKEQPASMGKILNLMRGDVYEVSQRFWDFPSIVTKPLQLVLAICLLWQLIGAPVLLGIAWVAVIQFINAGFVRFLLATETSRRKATDERLQSTTQFVEAIRHLRWYDWQDKWLGNIMEARQKELFLRIKVGLWGMGIAATNLAAGALFPVFSFFAYTFIAGRPLRVDVAFPALALFQMLESSMKEVPQLIIVLLNASVAMRRLEKFMEEPDKEEPLTDDSSTTIELHKTTWAWPGSNKIILKDLDLQFPPGLSVICGKVGCGKTALLEGILGELDQIDGHSVLPNAMVGYCAQSPWLQNMSIRDNILFNFPYDAVRYKKVIDACALTPDLATFKHGDLSAIGENGIGLSGGQKARVALARAVYSNSRILLLDDPLAPLDQNTAESIVRKLFCGPLMKDRTVVLVTHRVDLCTHLADQVIEITDGVARVLESSEVEREIKLLAREQESNNASHGGEGQHFASEEDANAAVPDKFIEDEHRASGGVVARVYWTYIKAGKLRWWTVVIVLFAFWRVLVLLNQWFLKAWGEAYGNAEVQQKLPFSITAIGDGLFEKLPSPEDDVRPWLIWYFAIGVVQTVLFTLSQCGLLVILFVAARDLFARVLQKVCRANFRFYDVTPVGRLMNRLTSDIGMLDGGITWPLQMVALYIVSWSSCMFVIAFTTPVFFGFAVVMTVLFLVIFNLYLPTSQSLRRLEMASLSPLMSNFGILVDGLATIRAFKAQAHFQSRNIEVTDAFQKMDHFYWSVQSWLLYRFDTLSAISTFALTALALYQGLSAGMTAFVLTTAAQFVDATHGLCKVYGQLQMDFVSVERVVELLDLDEEPRGEVQPPAVWPSNTDSIIFDNVTLKYAPHLEPSLSNVSFTIPGGATCAILGRTGSGKSTLALALLATMRPECGNIFVGSMDISKVDVHAWRQRISFVAQDPVLFPGTLRQNIDPLQEHTDQECLTVLRRVLGEEWTLDSVVDAGGKNLSQGQRQLVGIGRAVLRRSPVVVLDEATASIDMGTAAAIYDVLREELRHSTVITIAHRLEAVKDVDYCVRLDAGRVVESGPVASVTASATAE
ncbi:ATP-binding cassette subfamily C (CFTR/MRP) member 1 [Microdochium nivale]|nr:ATP-binding cassette subfamily C (CFTR/MRP) member 1 [Microdochium nivale]